MTSEGTKRIHGLIDEMLEVLRELSYEVGRQEKILAELTSERSGREAHLDGGSAPTTILSAA